jgi:segregation and condensation protein A
MAENMTQEDSYHFFTVELDQFSGPIDLLLHLVKQNELPIEKISLAKICDQYMSCIEQVKQFDLEIAGEYLVIAATLLSVKSSILLNDPVQLIENEDGLMVDPHEELLARLREAQVFKDGASFLDQCDQLEHDVFVGLPNLDGVGTALAPLKPHDPIALGKAFRRILEGVKDSKAVYSISIESVSIVERMMWVLDKLKVQDKPISFVELIPDLNSRSSIIGSFIALLELCRRQAIALSQEDSFGDIKVALAGSGDFDFSAMTSEFDQENEVDDEKQTANA